MNKLRRISRVFESAEEIIFDDHSKFIFMSDCHRGTGDWADSFSKNRNIFFAALNHYYKEGYTYIELGDGDELWQNRRFTDIIEEHRDIFWAMSRFHSQNRLYLLYGNHDIEKRNTKYLESVVQKCWNVRDVDYINLFKNVKSHEGLVLRYKNTDHKILLIHGHQVDFLNYELWRLSKFLVRYLWRPLESLGVNDPTRTAKNYKKRQGVAKWLTEWVKKEKHMLIAGHNHKPAFSEVGEPPYFNDGSCVHPRCITGIELCGGEISLIKWSVKTKDDGTLYIGRDILAGPRRVRDYFNAIQSD